ncbi:MAG: phosphate ABC transporter permease subunit PstC [Deltaproteobacteria bacterium]|nr:phosphate ABC transporter permease subunit PstC [Deltaproteobacteria bacterium]
MTGRAAPWHERVIEIGLFACAGVSVLTTIGIVAVLLGETLQFFGEVSILDFLTDTQWTPLFSDKHFGIWPLLSGTLVTSGVAIAVALPFGLLAAIYLSEIASPRVRSLVKPSLELLAGVPTVVYGYFALVTLTPLLQHVVPGLSGFNALSPGIVMGVMIMPLISSLSEDAIHAVPQSLREASYGLGASKLATIFRVVLPTARSGIAASVTLAASRAIGETMIVAIAAGQQPRLGIDPRQPFETMTAYIVKVSLGDIATGTTEFRTIFAVGSALFVMTLSMNLLAMRLARSFRGAL